MKPIEELLEEFGGESDDVLLLIKEMASLVGYYRRLLDRSALDALTGLPGATSFREFVKDIESRAATVGVIFFDVNDLKYYNDTKGHGSGDLLLQKAAESIHFICRDGVRGFRIGGDEFAVVITNCEEQTIDTLLSAWQEKLLELNAVDDGIHCSVAVGSAFASGEYSFSDALKLADERMYADKVRMKSKNSKNKKG